MTLNFSQFVDNWPESRKGQFSYEALRAIFDYYEQYTEDTGEEIEFDPIAICCEWSEYESLAEVQGSYSNIKDLADLADHTTVLQLEKGSLVIVQY